MPCAGVSSRQCASGALIHIQLLIHSAHHKSLSSSTRIMPCAVATCITELPCECGWYLVGSKGQGPTRQIGVIRGRCAERQCCFRRGLFGTGALTGNERFRPPLSPSGPAAG